MAFREFIDLNVCWSIIKETDFCKLSGRQTLRKQLTKPGNGKKIIKSYTVDSCYLEVKGTR